MPKLPPPPRRPQNRSACSRSLARRTLAVGGHDLGSEQVVDRRAVAAHQPADAAAEREPGDAGVGDDAADGGEPVRLGCGVELAPQHAAPGARRPGGGVDLDRAHRRQVDHEAVVAYRLAGDAVPAAAHGDLQLALAGEPQGGGDVGRARRSARSAPGAGRSRRSRPGAPRRTARRRGAGARRGRSRSPWFDGPRVPTAGQVHLMDCHGAVPVGDWSSWRSAATASTAPSRGQPRSWPCAGRRSSCATCCSAARRSASSRTARPASRARCSASGCGCWSSMASSSAGPAAAAPATC